MTRGLLALLLLALAGCAGLDFRYHERARAERLKSLEAPIPPEATFLVLSDVHFYAPALWEAYPAFIEIAGGGGKMVHLCERLLDTAADVILAARPDFVLICGDVTRDGEAESHWALSLKLRAVEAAGVPVYVVPGNHDILNPLAERFDEEGRLPADTISPPAFSRFYAPFGYREAIRRDPASLSYVAEPVEGLWLLAMDSCLYEDNVAQAYPETDGALTQERVDWIEGVLLEAALENKAVIAMMHHGVLEHYPRQAWYADRFVIDDFDEIAEMLAAYHVRLVFTGHYHAQDITGRAYPERGGFLLDVETGSLSTFPCPIRKISITKDGSAWIDTVFLDKIEGMPFGSMAFRDYAQSFIHSAATAMAYRNMRAAWVGEETARVLSTQVADAYCAHTTGDERITDGRVFGADGGGLMAALVEWAMDDFIKSLWTDLPPGDNCIRIDLKTGEWDSPVLSPSKASIQP